MTTRPRHHQETQGTTHPPYTFRHPPYPLPAESPHSKLRFPKMSKSRVTSLKNQSGCNYGKMYFALTPSIFHTEPIQYCNFPPFTAPVPTQSSLTHPSSHPHPHTPTVTLSAASLWATLSLLNVTIYYDQSPLPPPVPQLTGRRRGDSAL